MQLEIGLLQMRNDDTRNDVIQHLDKLDALTGLDKARANGFGREF